MSTRCNIEIKDKNNRESLMLYHHYDGYPSGVGRQLDLLCKSGTFGNGCVGEIANRLVKAGISRKTLWNLTDAEMAEVEFDNCGTEYEKFDDGYEITTGLHGDIEYLYTLEVGFGTKKLTCRKGECEWDDYRKRNIFNEEKTVFEKRYDDGWRPVKYGEVTEQIKESVEEVMDSLDRMAEMKEFGVDNGDRE